MKPNSSWMMPPQGVDALHMAVDRHQRVADDGLAVGRDLLGRVVEPGHGDRGEGKGCDRASTHTRRRRRCARHWMPSMARVPVIAAPSRSRRPLSSSL